MRLRQIGQLWLVSLPRAEQDKKQGLKDAGFRFHWEALSEKCPHNCLVCELAPHERYVWYTGNSEVGKKLQAELESPSAEPVRWDEVQQAADPSRAVDAEIEVPCPPALAYRGFQKGAIAFARTHQNVLLGDAMGLGKTIEAIGIVNDCEAKRVLVVCPATLRGNWRTELRRWLALDRPIYLPDHVDDLRDSLPESFVCIVNAEKLIANKHHTGQVDEKGNPIVSLKERAGGLFQRLYEVAWDVLIVDEAHRVKNANAALTKRVIGCHTSKKKEAWGLADRAKRLLFLTGTPLPNRPKELWTILNRLCPAEFDQEFPFLLRYCDAHKETIYLRSRPGQPPDTREVWKTDGASNLAELQRRMRGSVMVRRLKEDVLKELPPKVRQILPVTLPETRKLALAEEAFLQDNPEFASRLAAVEIERAVGDPMTLAVAKQELEHATDELKIDQISKLRQEIAIAKLPLVIEHVNALQEDGAGKVVVMAHHHAVLEGLVKEFGSRCVGLWGETKQADREGLVQAFQTQADKTVFVGGILAAGVGITLTAAQTMVFAEIDWVPGNLWQAEDRIHRIGQLGSALIQYLIVDGSIEANILSTVLAKDLTACAALDTVGRSTEPVPAELRLQVSQALSQLDSYVGDKKACRLPTSARRMFRQLCRSQALTDGKVWFALSLMKKHKSLLPAGGAWTICVGG